MSTDQLRYQALELAQRAAYQAATGTGVVEETATTVARAEAYYAFLAQGLPAPTEA